MAYTPVWAALKTVLNPVSQDPDIAPVVKAASRFLSITVGESPLVILFTVTDAENDAFDVKGSGLRSETIYRTKLPSFIAARFTMWRDGLLLILP